MMPPQAFFFMKESLGLVCMYIIEYTYIHKNFNMNEHFHQEKNKIK